MLKPFKIRYFKSSAGPFLFELILDNHVILGPIAQSAHFVMDHIVHNTSIAQQDIDIIHAFVVRRRLNQESTLEIMVEVSN